MFILLILSSGDWDCICPRGLRLGLVSVFSVPSVAKPMILVFGRHVLDNRQSQHQSIPSNRFARQILLSMSACRAIMRRCAMGEPAPCMDSMR